MTLAVTSEQNIFCKNHGYIYKRVFRVAVNTYVPIFRDVDACGGRKLRTDTHTCGTTTVMMIIKIIRSTEAHMHNVCKTAQH